MRHLASLLIGLLTGSTLATNALAKDTFAPLPTVCTSLMSEMQANNPGSLKGRIARETPVEAPRFTMDNGQAVRMNPGFKTAKMNNQFVRNRGIWIILFAGHPPYTQWVTRGFVFYEQSLSGQPLECSISAIYPPMLRGDVWTEAKS